MTDRNVQHRKTARTHRLQIKIWISEGDYEWLSSEARARDVTMSDLMRQLLRLDRARPRASSSHREGPAVSPSSHAQGSGYWSSPHFSMPRLFSV